jgi:hypothetical protein
MLANGGWSKWEGWGECSATCSVGMRSRKRSCNNPRPHRFGDHCFGNSIEDELCDGGSCAGKTYAKSNFDYRNIFFQIK